MKTKGVSATDKLQTMDDLAETPELDNYSYQPPEGADNHELVLPADSESSPEISVILPTMNEEEGVGACIAAIKDAFEEQGLEGEIIISDSSTDCTPQIARSAGAIVVKPDKKGYGYAYKYAIQYARGDYVVIGDADTTYDYRQIPHLLRPIVNNEADFVIGSRFDGEIKSGAMPPLHRYIGNPFLTGFLNFFYDVGVSDAHSGFRAIRRDALESLDLRSNGMEFASEMIIRASAQNLRIKEVPITYHPREGDATLNSFRDGWRHVKFMMLNTPVYLFSVPGTLLMTIGTTLMTLAFFQVSFGPDTFGIHTMVAGSLVLIIGYQIFVLGVFSSILLDSIEQKSDPITRVVTEQFSLELGASLGSVLLLAGVSIASYFVGKWIASGFKTLPYIFGDIVAFTAILLGVQTIFYSFFLSMTAELRA